MMQEVRFISHLASVALFPVSFCESMIYPLCNEQETEFFLVLLIMVQGIEF